MIIISDCNKDIVIPAGLGDNPGVVYEKSGVESLNGQQGDLTLKTVNGNELLGEGDVAIDTGVESLNGQKGALTLKTVNGNELTGEGNIEIKGGVETVNGETGDVKIKTVNGQSLMGEGDVPVDVGVETLNGQKGALTLKTVNGAEMLGEGNVTIDTGVESLNGQKGNLKIKSVNGAEMLGEGNVTIDTGVETLNGQKGALTLKTVNGNELTGDGNIEIKAGVESVNGETGAVKIKSVNGQSLMGEGDVPVDVGVETLNGQKGALTLKTVNGNDMLGDGNIEIQAGSDNVIVLDSLTQEQLTALFNKIDKTGPIKEIFEYRSARSFYTYYDNGYSAICMYFLEVTPYKGGNIRAYMINEDGIVYGLSHSINYPNFLFFNVDNHTDEGADLNCEYDGDFYYFLNSTWTSPNGYFLVLKKGIGDSTKFMVLPLTVLCDKEPDTTNIPIRIQFTANEKLYTYLHGDADGKWLFESAKPITGGGATNALTYKQITNESRQEVYDDVKAHWSDASGYTGNYVYFYQKGKDQIIFDEVKFENNEAYFNSASVTFTSGQVHNPGVRLLCSIVPSEGDVQIAEKYTTISSIDGMQYISRSEVNGNAAISFDANNYGNGYGIYSTVNTGEANGLFGARFRDGIDGYKGNTPANIFTDGTNVFMAFDVVDYHYVYKVQADGSWAFVSKTKIGGVQSSEVSNIKVLTQAEYDALTTKDENVLYCIKG